MHTDTKRDWNFSVKLNDDERQLIEQLAQQRGTSAGSIVRWAVKRLLEQEGAQPAEAKGQ